MISSPHLPTDNLYKFIFILGIVSLLACAYIADHQKSETEKQRSATNSLYFRTKRQVKTDSLNSVKVQQLKDKAAANHLKRTQYQTLVDSLFKADTSRLGRISRVILASRMNKREKINRFRVLWLTQKAITARHAKRIDSLNKAARKENATLNTTLNSYSSSLKNAKENRDKYNEQRERVNLKFGVFNAGENGFQQVVFYTLFILGCLGVTLGGLLWYYIQQKPQDEILKIQLQLMRNELKKQSVIDLKDGITKLTDSQLQ